MVYVSPLVFPAAVEDMAAESGALMIGEAFCWPERPAAGTAATY
jgi:hypothetical protein